MKRVLSQKLFYAVVQQMAEAVILVDFKTKRVLQANPAFEKLLGYSVEEAMGLTLYDYIAHDKADIDFEVKAVLDHKQRYHGERKYRRKDGMLLDVEVSAALVLHNRQKLLCVVARDISGRKKAEKELQESEEKLRFLSSHLLTIQETERTRISTGLHDELGQALMVLKLQVNSIETRIGEHQVGLKRDCKHVQQYVDQIIENVRRISQDLTPGILEDLSLSDALRWLIGDFVKHRHMESLVSIPDLSGCISHKDEIIIYRIFQEALTNIGKHSGASHLSAVVEKKDNGIVFSIADDGRGFDMKQAVAKKRMGLAAMSERVRMLRGDLDIRTQPGRGTKVNFFIPPQKEPQE